MTMCVKHLCRSRDFNCLSIIIIIIKCWHPKASSSLLEGAKQTSQHVSTKSCWSEHRILTTHRRVLIHLCVGQTTRNFGIMQEYNDRKNKKLTNNVLCTDRPMYWVTSSRPSNFGDPLEAKTKVDNWFDENR